MTISAAKIKMAGCSFKAPGFSRKGENQIRAVGTFGSDFSEEENRNSDAVTNAGSKNEPPHRSRTEKPQFKRTIGFYVAFVTGFGRQETAASGENHPPVKTRSNVNSPIARTRIHFFFDTDKKT